MVHSDKRKSNLKIKSGGLQSKLEQTLKDALEAVGNGLQKIVERTGGTWERESERATERESERERERERRRVFGGESFGGPVLLSWVPMSMQIVN